MSELASSGCPFDHRAAQQELWLQNRDAYDELRDIFDPISAEAATSLEALVAQNPQEVTTQSERYSITTNVPYDIPAGLPPTLFMGSDFQELPTRKHDLKRLAYEHSKYAESLVGKVRGIHPTGKGSASSVQDVLLSLLGKENPIDMHAWQEYEEVYDNEIERNVYLLGSLAMNRLTNAGDFFDRIPQPLLPDVRQATHFSYATAGALYNNQNSNTITNNTAMVMLPIGEYGADFTHRLIRTTAVAIDHTANTCLSIAEEKTVGREDFLEMTTMRGADFGRHINAAEGALATVDEGILTIAQTIALLTHEKVPGYETGDELMEAIIDQGIVNKTTRLMMLGLIGPLTLEGRFFPGFLQANSTGELFLDPQIKHALEGLRNSWVETVFKNRQKDDGEVYKGGFGLICPENTPTGGVTTLSKAMKGVHRLMSDRLDGPAYEPWRMPNHRFNIDNA